MHRLTFDPGQRRVLLLVNDTRGSKTNLFVYDKTFQPSLIFPDKYDSQLFDILDKALKFFSWLKHFLWCNGDEKAYLTLNVVNF